MLVTRLNGLCRSGGSGPGAKWKQHSQHRWCHATYIHGRIPSVLPPVVPAVDAFVEICHRLVGAADLRLSEVGFAAVAIVRRALHCRGSVSGWRGTWTAIPSPRFHGLLLTRLVAVTSPKWRTREGGAAARETMLVSQHSSPQRKNSPPLVLSTFFQLPSPPRISSTPRRANSRRS